MAGPRQWSTQSLRIHRFDWSAVLTGEKTEVRNTGKSATLAPHLAQRVPLPIVAWSTPSFGGAASHCLIVVERAWSEPLGAISADSLRREGFDGVRDFKEYWKARHKTVGYRPLTTVHVTQIRPWNDAQDAPYFGGKILEHLYGAWLPARA